MTLSRIDGFFFFVKRHFLWLTLEIEYDTVMDVARVEWFSSKNDRNEKKKWFAVVTWDQNNGLAI